MFETIKTVWNGHPDNILFENVSLEQLKPLEVKIVL